MIPQDVWEKLTVNDAAAAGMLENVGLFRRMPSGWLWADRMALMADIDNGEPLVLVFLENLHDDTKQAAQSLCSKLRLVIAMRLVGETDAVLHELAHAIEVAKESRR
jgi:hypothetical protein